jgi:hypothetical protein
MTELIKQRTAMPTRKVNAAILGGAIATITMGLLAAFAPEIYGRFAQVPGMETALGSLVSVGLAYVVKDRL